MAKGFKITADKKSNEPNGQPISYDSPGHHPPNWPKKKWSLLPSNWTEGLALIFLKASSPEDNRGYCWPQLILPSNYPTAAAFCCKYDGSNKLAGGRACHTAHRLLSPSQPYLYRSTPAQRSYFITWDDHNESHFECSTWHHLFIQNNRYKGGGNFHLRQGLLL